MVKKYVPNMKMNNTSQSYWDLRPSPPWKLLATCATAEHLSRRHVIPERERVQKHTSDCNSKTDSYRWRATGKTTDDKKRAPVEARRSNQIRHGPGNRIEVVPRSYNPVKRPQKACPLSLVNTGTFLIDRRWRLALSGERHCCNAGRGCNAARGRLYLAATPIKLI